MVKKKAALPVIAVRTAIDKDVNQLRDLIVEYLEFYRAVPPSEGELSEFILKICHTPQLGCFFVAEADNELCGFATIYTTCSSFKAKTSLIFSDLYVIPELRRHGIATKLFQAVQNYYKQGDYALLEWMTSPMNTAAISFYLRQGGKRTDWVVFNLNKPE